MENTNLVYPLENERIETTLIDRQVWNYELETTISNALKWRFRALEERARAYLHQEMQREDVKRRTDRIMSGMMQAEIQDKEKEENGKTEYDGQTSWNNVKVSCSEKKLHR
jgi:hypothetical protein